MVTCREFRMKEIDEFPEFTVILMFEFWREATAVSVPGLLRQSGRRRPEVP